MRAKMYLITMLNMRENKNQNKIAKQISNKMKTFTLSQKKYS